MGKITGTYDEWKALGDEVRLIRNQLIACMCNPEHQALLTKKEISLLGKAIDQIDRFKSVADDRMFNKVSPLEEETPKWVKVFY